METYIERVTLTKQPEESYYMDIPAIQHLYHMDGLSFPAGVTFLIGENGIGKSTLIEAIAVASGFNPEGGTKNFTFSTNMTHSNLYECMRISRKHYPKDGFFLRAESFYNVASNIDAIDEENPSQPKLINSYGGVSLHHQSHGESFLSLIQNRFGGHGLYILDEPEAALSPMKLMTLLRMIYDLVQDGSQFIIATHSPILMAYPEATIYELSQEGIQSIAYKDSEHYQITKRFLDNPDQMLYYLLKD